MREIKSIDTRSWGWILRSTCVNFGCKRLLYNKKFILLVLFCHCEKEFHGKVFDNRSVSRDCLPIVASFHSTLVFWIRITTSWGKWGVLNDKHSARMKNTNSGFTNEKAEKVAINMTVNQNKMIRFSFFGNSTNVDLLLTTWENTIASFSGM